MSLLGGTAEEFDAFFFIYIFFKENKQEIPNSDDGLGAPQGKPTDPSWHQCVSSSKPLYFSHLRTIWSKLCVIRAGKDKV